jgi:hypothetical protein
LAVFAGIQLALAARMETAQPELCDPAFGFRRAGLLRALKEAGPGRPVVLVIGTSRTGLGFCPEALSPRLKVNGRKPLVFNFGLPGVGLLHELIYLRRLLAAGVRPDWVFIEVLWSALYQEAGPANPTWLPVDRLVARDLPVVRRYCWKPARLYRQWLAERLTPCFFNRFTLLGDYAPRWLPSSTRAETWRLGTALGWTALCLPPEPGARQRALAHARKEYQSAMAGFRVCNSPNLALREMIALCQQRGIKVALHLMPEGEVFRSWYLPAVPALVDAYLMALSRECGVPVVDTRKWMPEAAFMDSHHLDREGARIFTRRFGGQVLRPLLAGKPCRALLGPQ